LLLPLGRSRIHPDRGNTAKIPDGNKAVNTRSAKSLTYAEAGGAARLGPRRRGEGGGGLDPGHDACGVGHWIRARRRGGGGGSTGAERGCTALLGRRSTFSCLVAIVRLINDHVLSWLQISFFFRQRFRHFFYLTNYH
jgi:hypothetical protein